MNTEQLLHDIRNACDANDHKTAINIISSNPDIAARFNDNIDIINGFYNVCHYGNVEFASYLLSVNKHFNRQINFARAHNAFSPTMFPNNIAFSHWITHLNMNDIL